MAELELTGPFDGALLDVPAGGHTRIEGVLLPAETRILRAPIPVGPLGTPIEPRVRLEHDANEIDTRPGRLRFLGWRSEGANRLRDLPAALRARSRPPLAGAEPSAGGAALALLAAGFVLGLALRRRPLAALALGAATAAVVFCAGPRSLDASLPHVLLEEGDAGSPTWLEVEAVRGRLHLSAEPNSVHVETQPVDALLECRASLNTDTGWEIAAQRAVLYRLSAFEPGERAFTRASNRWGDLTEAWVREEGSWSARGSWKLGTPLPAEVTGAPPPGWLSAGLPQGTTILLGRMHGRPGEGPVYFRLSGF